MVVLYIFLVAPSLETRELKQERYAHRGLHSENQKIKENSIEAFRLAVEKGYGAELDVQLTKDGQVVVYHDDSLLRLENDNRLVSGCTLEELREYQLPLLTEVLELAAGKVELIVELKHVPFAQIKPFCQKVYEVLEAYEGTYCIESFNPFVVAWFKKHAPNVTRGQLVQPAKEYPHFWQGLVLNSLLYQFLARPHFIAFEIENSRWNPALWVNRILKAKFVLWTVPSSRQPLEKSIDAYIFEDLDA